MTRRPKRRSAPMNALARVALVALMWSRAASHAEKGASLDEPSPHACNATGLTGDQVPFDCPAAFGPDVNNFTLYMPRFLIPANDASFMYMRFDLTEYGIDPDSAYHIIASRPRVDSVFLHHILYYICRPDENVTVSDTPRTDTMVPLDACRMPFGVWSNGIPGECYDDEYGIKIGQGAPRKLHLQFHYNNPDRCDNQWDHSGVTFYYVANLRPKNAAVLGLGRHSFSIPPGRESYLVNGTCSPECTSGWKSPVIGVRVEGHMHGQGKRIHVDHRRDGILLRKFAVDDQFAHGFASHWKTIDPRIEFLPGDQLTVVCEYSTVGRNDTTYDGMSTTRNEMCIVFMLMYPAEALVSPYCLEPSYCPTSNTTVLD